MNRSGAGFDRLASAYRALEYLAFGRDLERARFTYLDRLAGCGNILLLGEGDGRFAERLARIAPRARILCIDSSARMIARAARRIAARDRVTFLEADVRTFAPEAGRFDAVVTLFFLDCFDAGEVASIVARIGGALGPGALWLFADFSVPHAGIRRFRALAWLALLYTFFRRTTGLAVSSLPPSEEILEAAGWRRLASREFQWGMIRCAVYTRDARSTAAPAASG